MRMWNAERFQLTNERRFNDVVKITDSTIPSIQFILIYPEKKTHRERQAIQLVRFQSHSIMHSQQYFDWETIASIIIVIKQMDGHFSSSWLK